MKTYHQTVNSILLDLKQQIPNIKNAIEICRDTISKNNMIYVLGTGHSHMQAEEFVHRLAGLPYFKAMLQPEFMLHQHPIKSTAIERLETYADIVEALYPTKENDTILLFSNSGRNGLLVEMAKRSKEKGMKVICIVNHTHATNCTSRHSSNNNMTTYADVVIDNCGVYGDACYQVQDVMMGSTSSITGLFIVQMINIGLATALETNCSIDDTLESYFNSYLSTFDLLGNLSSALQTCASIITNSILNKHKFFIMGTGHSHMIAEEMYSRAGGLACITPILEDEIMVHVHPNKSALIENSYEYASILMKKYNIQKGDTILLVSNSGKSIMTVELARLCKEIGVNILVLTNLKQSTESIASHSSNKKLYEYADYILDNMCDVGDANFVVNGIKRGPKSSSICCYIVQYLAIEIAKELDKQKETIPVLNSGNIDGSKERNQSIKEKYGSYFIGYQH